MVETSSAMIKTLSYRDPDYPTFTQSLYRRPSSSNDSQQVVSKIIASVAACGDQAVFDYAAEFDKVKLTAETLFVSDAEFTAARKATTSETKRAIKASLKNIRAFAARSLRKDWSRRNSQGVRVGERFTPFDRVGVYVPGGKAPLVSTALMTAGFAQAAKVPRVLAATPCGADGKVNPALLYALRAAGVSEVIKVGGAQAIAAMALGTKSIAPVDRIFGPGNQFVVEAKRQLVGTVSIDLLPGPSEILVVADETGNSRFIAADLLAQAEHGGDSSIGLITTSEVLIASVEAEITRQLMTSERAAYIEEVLKKNAFLLLARDLEEATTLANDYAPEHLTLVCANERKWSLKIRTAGAIYLGNYSAVAVGDFLAGPSHTLPTGGSGRSFSGLCADHFQRRTSIVEMDVKAVKKSAKIITKFARLEGLDAHGKSVVIRCEEPG